MFCWGNMRERDYLEDTGIDGRIILKWILEIVMEGESMDRIDLPRDRERWKVLVKAVMNFRVQ